MTYDHQVTFAQDERQALCALLHDLGPDQPTLCAGWRTADLAGHLVLREHRPDAALGMAGGPLAARTRRLQDRLVRRTDFGELVELLSTGPPRLSVFGLPGVDERANAVEFFVHHEDVRRGQPSWTPRALRPGLSELLWGRLKIARLLLRKAPVGVEFARADEPAAAQPDEPGRPAADHPQPPSLRLTVSARTPVVTITGTPAELTMWTYGRRPAAQVRLDGSDKDIAALTAAG